MNARFDFPTGLCHTPGCDNVPAPCEDYCRRCLDEWLATDIRGQAERDIAKARAKHTEKGRR